MTTPQAIAVPARTMRLIHAAMVTGVCLFALVAHFKLRPPTAREAPAAVYLGVRLPGSRDVFGATLPLQGILKLGFRAIEFLVGEAQGARTYTLRLRDFAIRLLGLSFPPGHNDVYLFGNPDQGASSKVGWYAAYAADDDAKKQDAAPTRRQVRGARAAVRALPPPADAAVADPREAP